MKLAATLPDWSGLRERLAGCGRAAARQRAPAHPRLGGRRHRAPAAVSGFDTALIWVVVCLLAFSLVMVYSASVAMPDSPKFSRYDTSYFLVRQSAFVAVAFVAAVVTLQIPIATWEKWAPWLFATTLALLILTLIPFIGKGVNGARRWIPLGIMNFQPSELAKLAMAMYAASYMVRKMEVKENFFKAVWPMAVSLGVVGVLLLAEPDMGAFMVIAAIALGILFLGGVNGRMFLLSVAVLVGAFVLMIVFSEFRRSASSPTWTRGTPTTRRARPTS
jgi:cell division protein FtsW